MQGCAKVAEIAKPEFKARMTVPLAVAGAFHTEFMAPAVEKLRAALTVRPFSNQCVQLVSATVDSKGGSLRAHVRAC